MVHILSGYCLLVITISSETYDHLFFSYSSHHPTILLPPFALLISIPLPSYYPHTLTLLPYYHPPLPPSSYSTTLLLPYHPLGGPETEFGTLLLSVVQGWNSYDVMKFVLRQKEVTKITYNSKDYTIKDIPPEDEDE